MSMSLKSYLCGFPGFFSLQPQIQAGDGHLFWSSLTVHQQKKKPNIQQLEVGKHLSWAALSLREPQPLHIVFSLFMDWVDSQGNKKRGEQQEMGILALTCLNLPPSLRNRNQNTYVAGITPGPLSPDMQIFCHIVDSLVESLVYKGLFLEKWIKIGTSQYPQGWLVCVKRLLLLGDMVGMHKVAGYASHYATHCCSMFWENSEDMD